MQRKKEEPREKWFSIVGAPGQVLTSQNTCIQYYSGIQVTRNVGWKNFLQLDFTIAP